MTNKEDVKSKKVVVLNRISAFIIDFIFVYVVSKTIFFTWNFIITACLPRTKDPLPYYYFYIIFIIIYLIYYNMLTICSGKTIGEKSKNLKYEYKKNSNILIKTFLRSILKTLFIMTGLFLVDLIFIIINKENKSLIDIIVGEYVKIIEITKEEKFKRDKRYAIDSIVLGLLLLLVPLIFIIMVFCAGVNDGDLAKDESATAWLLVFMIVGYVLVAPFGLFFLISGLVKNRDCNILKKREQSK